ncbi:MAG TPA: hypothetical protein ENI23_10855 [bacterium]|nr:hypothetical protein [bacterium]
MTYETFLVFLEQNTENEPESSEGNREEFLKFHENKCFEVQNEIKTFSKEKDLSDEIKKWGAASSNYCFSIECTKRAINEIRRFPKINGVLKDDTQSKKAV